MIDAALEADVILYCLPPKTTHRLQPCDVGAFSPLKRAWNGCCDKVLTETGEQLQAKDVVREYLVARAETFKEQTVKQAWLKSGIGVDESGMRPVCKPSIFTAADFAPSVSTSTQLHLPEGYPFDLTHGTQEKSTDSDSDSEFDNSDCGDAEYYQERAIRYKEQRDATRVQ